MLQRHGSTSAMALDAGSSLAYFTFNAALRIDVSLSLSGEIYVTTAAQQPGGERLLPRLPP
jgi:hypothetical protein